MDTLIHDSIKKVAYDMRRIVLDIDDIKDQIDHERCRSIFNDIKTLEHDLGELLKRTGQLKGV